VRLAVALTVAMTTAAHASPNVPLDDWVYDDLAARDGGVAPLSEDRARELLGLPPMPDGWWIRPDRITTRVAAYAEDDRPYSTAARPRDVEGNLALACEGQQGRPCGDGEGVFSELDASAGYGATASATIRLRATTGTRGYADDLAIDRAYARGELGPLALELGRDVLAVGPRAHTRVAWSDNAPPLDQIRLQTARPYRLADGLDGDFLYVVGRLRDPLQQHPPLVTITRMQLDIAERVEVALHQELAMGGDGAPSFDLYDFVTEHFRRGDSSAGPTDSSNRRFGGDIAVHLRGARLYYQLVFEDIRMHVIDALHYDADHVLGVEVPWLVVELLRTGVRSYEHVPQRTAFTNDARTVGAPLGPDAMSLYARGSVALPFGTVLPWLELARLSSDTYTFVDHGPITQATSGPAELRYRAGARLRLPIARELRAEAEASFEHVSALAFDPNAGRNNVGMMLTLVWQPSGFLH
jgi:hypothetical protein